MATTVCSRVKTETETETERETETEKEKERETRCDSILLFTPSAIEIVLLWWEHIMRTSCPTTYVRNKNEYGVHYVRRTHVHVRTAVHCILYPRCDCDMRHCSPLQPNRRHPGRTALAVALPIHWGGEWREGEGASALPARSFSFN